MKKRLLTLIVASVMLVSCPVLSAMATGENATCSAEDTKGSIDNVEDDQECNKADDIPITTVLLTPIDAPDTKVGLGNDAEFVRKSGVAIEDHGYYYSSDYGLGKVIGSTGRPDFLRITPQGYTKASLTVVSVDDIFDLHVPLLNSSDQNFIEEFRVSVDYAWQDNEKLRFVVELSYDEARIVYAEDVWVYNPYDETLDIVQVGDDVRLYDDGSYIGEARCHILKDEAIEFTLPEKSEYEARFSFCFTEVGNPKEDGDDQCDKEEEVNNISPNSYDEFTDSGISYWEPPYGEPCFDDEEGGMFSDDLKEEKQYDHTLENERAAEERSGSGQLESGQEHR